MKLRTKITAAAALVILIAAAVSDGVIWGICRSALLREAEQTALRQMAVLQTDLGTQQMHSGREMTVQELTFFFKQRGDDYAVCMRDGELLYNQTALTAAELAGGEPAGSSAPETYRLRRCSYKGMPLLITETNLQMERTAITLYRISDLTPVMRRLRLLALGMLGVLLGVGIPAVILLYLVIRRTVKPLGLLSDSAKQIAAGAYDKRASVGGSDEVALLAADFNKMADAVQEKIAALTDSEQRKTMFMADFSHELKTPLTAISGYAQTLRTVKLSAEDTAEALGYICSESKRLDRLAKKMMRLMQLDRTESLQMTQIACNALLEAVTATCRPIAERQGVFLHIAQSAGVISGDFDLLHDALCNLTDNAVKASQPGQTVTLGAENGRITVSDTGCGIPQTAIRNLTEPFYMVDKSRSRTAGGAGLGLSIVKQIMQLHGAEMSIESAVGQGTAVTLQFAG